MQRVVLTLLTFVHILCSCSDEYTSVRHYSMDIAGIYRCTSATWDHPMAIDVNNDGIPNRDLAVEVHGIPGAETALLKSTVRITYVNAYESWSDRFFVKIPLQGLLYDESVEKYSVGLTTSYVEMYFTYSIDSSGDVHISKATIMDFGLEPVLVPEEKDITIAYLGKGVLDITINTTFYDFNSQRFVTGPVHYRYERIYSDPYETSWKTLVK